MDWISGWIQGIIIAVIISTIIEMILPEGTTKKYIKVVIGIYILFSIVSPVISKVTGGDFRVSDIFDLDEYIEASKNSGTLQNKLSNQNENQIKEIYISSIKNDIKEKIENKGYEVKNIEIEVENDEQYTLKKLNLQITKMNNTNSKNTENKTTNETVESVNEIKIQVAGNHNIAQNIQSDLQPNNNTNSNNQSNSKNKKDSISSQNKKELKEYLSSVYEISIKNIFINE